MEDQKRDITILDRIPVKLEAEAVLKRLKLRNESQRIRDMVREVIDLVTPVARPKAIYGISCASSPDRKTLEVDGLEFTSYVPTLNFGGERVFPYVATCGVEVDALKTENGDFMKRFILNQVKEMVLRAASEYLREHLKTTYGLTELTRVGPGEALGTISQQHKLFSLLGDVTGLIGVRLSEHNMMVPEKSSSGIFFETVSQMESCQLCPDAKCKGRRAKYDPALLKQQRVKSGANQG